MCNFFNNKIPPLNADKHWDYKRVDTLFTLEFLHSLYYYTTHSQKLPLCTLHLYVINYLIINKILIIINLFSQRYLIVETRCVNTFFHSSSFLPFARKRRKKNKRERENFYCSFCPLPASEKNNRWNSQFYHKNVCFGTWN